MTERIGFIGLGGMGLPMAKRVRACGYEVTICGHIRREPIEEMKSLGATEVSNPKEVAMSSDIVITMLRNDSDTGEVVLGENGVIEGIKDGGGIIMTSTLSPNFVRKVAESGKIKNLKVLDAPATGADMRSAEQGKLNFMVGGSKDTVEEYRSLLECMGRILYCGELGMGQIVKLTDNMTFLMTMSATFEALTWGIENGADEKTLVEFMKNGCGNSWTLQNWEFVRKVNVEPPPPITALGKKDLDYALRIARDLNLPCPIAAYCDQQFVKGSLHLPNE
ncbi:MAG: NAD(P)-dependent oxidoreductase [Chloroflexi bacterium]|nr:NAD(P)-dependent oxidoreductase [Chloroflexota bacterium]